MKMGGPSESTILLLWILVVAKLWLLASLHDCSIVFFDILFPQPYVVALLDLLKLMDLQARCHGDGNVTLAITITGYLIL